MVVVVEWQKPLDFDLGNDHEMSIVQQPVIRLCDEDLAAAIFRWSVNCLDKKRSEARVELVKGRDGCTWSAVEGDIRRGQSVHHCTLYASRYQHTRILRHSPTTAYLLHSKIVVVIVFHPILRQD
jgi:hypothetical protein